MFKELFCFFLSFFYCTVNAQEVQLIEKLKANKLSIVEINTKDNQNVDSKETYLKAGLRIYEYKNNTYKIISDSTEIKGRGNSTWELPKKPFRLKLYKAQSIEGMPSSRHWALLANFEDKSLSRTTLASDLGNYLGIGYVPRSIPVEVVLNGAHLGSYQLIEVVKIDPNRINITTVNTKNNITTGGAIFELNLRLDEQYNFYTNTGVPISIKEPDDLNAKTTEIAAQHYNYLVNSLNKAEDALFSENFTDTSIGYPKFFNVASVVDWYLTVEITKNFDVGEYSVFKYIDTKNNNKITYGPIWDFDLSSGNREGPIGFKAKVENTWLRRFFEDPNFEKLVKEKWVEKRAAVLSTLTSSINQNTRRVLSSAMTDQLIWEFATRPNDKSFKDDIWFLKNWLKERIEWLDQQFSDNPITYSPIVEDAFLSTEEDKTTTSKLNASTSSDTTAFFYIVKKPTKGIVEILNNSGDFKYTPYSNINGVDTFFYSKGHKNNLHKDTGRVILNISSINDLPVITNYKDTILEDAKLLKSNVNGLYKHSYDADGDALNFELLSTTRHGKLDLNKDGSFVYQPIENFNGVDSFIYKAYDIYEGADTGLFEINVLPVNDDPVFNKDTLLYQVRQNEKIVFDLQGEILKGVIDVDNKLDELEIEFDNAYIHGSLIKDDTKKVVYYPDRSFVGVDYLSYRVTDKIGYSKYSVIDIRVLPSSNIKSFDHIFLYPNPSKGIFYFNDLIADNILIFDYLGNKVGNYTYAQNGVKLQVNGSALPKGQYIMYLLHKNMIIAIKKIMLI